MLRRFIEKTASYKSVFGLVHFLVGAHKFRNKVLKIVVEELSLPPNPKVLDLGCARGDTFNVLPKCQYYGVDINSDFISSGQSYKSDNKILICSDARHIGGEFSIKFDVIFLGGLLHHLSDIDAKAVLFEARGLLGDNGCIVVVDPVRDKEQSLFSRLMCLFDAGSNIRDRIGYDELFKSVSLSIKSRTITHTSIPRHFFLMSYLTHGRGNFESRVHDSVY